MEYAELEIARLTEVARREQNAEWYGPEFYDFTPVTCTQPNTQCLSFRLVYAEETAPAMRRSLEEALVYHGCQLDAVTSTTVDGVFACSAVSQQGAGAIKRVRTLLRRWGTQGRITYIDAHERYLKPGPRAGKRRHHASG